MGTKLDYVYLPRMCETRPCLSSLTLTSCLYHFSQSLITIEELSIRHDNALHAQVRGWRWVRQVSLWRTSTTGQVRNTKQGSYKYLGGFRGKFHSIISQNTGQWPLLGRLLTLTTSMTLFDFLPKDFMDLPTFLTRLSVYSDVCARTSNWSLQL